MKYLNPCFCRSSIPQLYLLKVPRFLAFEPTVWSARTFQPPTTEHHSKEPALSSFSAYDTALSTMRWRHSPSDPTELQSNARVLRWSDGSLTLQLATDATAQYEILAKPLAPLQQNPPKPTPLSGPQLRGRNAPSGYDASQDSFTYLGAGSASAYCVRTTNKITTALSVKPNDQANSLESLEAAMAVINAKSGGAKARTGPKIMDIRGDPEKDKLAAIEAEKQKLRAQRRLENQQNRERERSSRVLGGVSRSGRGGLTVGDLEDEEGGSGRPRISRTKSSRGNKSRRDEYSEEEEEMYGRRGGPQDNYEKDDFVVDDEDESAGDDEDAEGDEDIDDIIESREGRPSPKRSRVDDERPAQSSPTSRPKRRRVVMSDDEDE
jgi:RNA polymerase-associated protein LEO1